MNNEYQSFSKILYLYGDLVRYGLSLLSKLTYLYTSIKLLSDLNSEMVCEVDL